MRATTSFALVCLCAVAVQITQGQLIRPRLVDAITDALGNSTANATEVDSCPVDPLTLTLDFSAVAEGCAALDGNATQEFCDSCLCGLVVLYMPAFRASGLVEVANITGTVPFASASTLIEQCSTTFAQPLVDSGINLTGVLALASCTFPDGVAPPCVEEAFKAASADVDFRDGVNGTVTNETDTGNVTGGDQIPPALTDSPPTEDVDSPPTVASPPIELADYPPYTDLPPTETPSPVSETESPPMMSEDMTPPVMDSPDVMTPPVPDVTAADGPSDAADRLDTDQRTITQPPNSAGSVRQHVALTLLAAMCLAFML